MKITSHKVTPIAFTDPPLRNAVGLHAPYGLRVILELAFEDGFTGISESPCTDGVNESLELVCQGLHGEDPVQLTRLLEKAKTLIEVDETRGDAPWDQRVWVHVQSALEVACLDYFGKRFGVRMCDLLGGAARDTVPYGAYLFYKLEGAGGVLGFAKDDNAQGWAAARQSEAMDVDGIVDQANAMSEAFGFRSIKLKGGVLPPEDEAAAMFALRDSFGPDVPLRLDPNAIWSVETGIRIGKKLDPIQEYLEDPVRGQEAMAEVGKAIESPLATNMCTTSFEDIPRSIELRSEDVILTDHHYWGGLRPCIELCRICKTFGRGISMHSNSHLGISMAAMTHLGACIPQLDYDLDTHYPWQSDEIIEGGPLEFENGTIAIPDGPGLGVSIDQEQLARLHKNYLESGLDFRDDESEMKKLDPDWEFKPIRW